MSQRREHIENTVSDLVSGFLYYDRKEDDELPRGAIEEAIESGEITIDEIVALFRAELESGVGACGDGHTSLRALCEAATPGPWIRSPDDVVIDDVGDTVADCSYSLNGDARYIAAVSPDVVLGLLDRIAYLEAPGECQSLHRLRAERDELAAEVAALQGRPEGALNEHWRRRAGVYRRTLDAAELQADETGWSIYGPGGLLVADADVTCEPDTSRLPRVNMRAAEAKARELGLLP